MLNIDLRVRSGRRFAQIVKKNLFFGQKLWETFLAVVVKFISTVVDWV